ncbi:MAG: tetratricopeptide repeat-containing sensor histidine kinase [Prolixibacteraceae bacterium]
MRAILIIVIIVTFQTRVGPELIAAVPKPDSQPKYPERAEGNEDNLSILNSFLENKIQPQNEQERLWNSLLIKSKILFSQELRDSALIISNMVVEECKTDGNRLFLMLSLLNLSILQQESYKFDEALKNMMHAERLLKNTDPVDLRFDIKNYLGLLYTYMENYSIAIQYFHEIHDSFLNKLDHNQKSVLYNNLGLVYLGMDNFHQAETLFKKAKDEATEANSSEGKTMAAFNLGKSYFRQKQYSNAWDLLIKSLRIFQEKGEKANAEEASRIMGMLYMEQGNHELAQDYFEQSLGLALELGNPKIILKNYHNIFTNYSMIREKTKNLNYLLLELDFFKKWAYLNDSLYQDQTSERILELEKQYETEKKNNQINLLEKEKQMAEDKLKIGQVQRKYLFIFVVLILMVLGFFIYSFSYYKRMTHLLQKQSRRIMNQQAHITRQNEKLQKAVGAQNKLFAIMAHDLRSPLVSLSNISKLINLYLRNNRYEDAEELSRQLDRKNDYLLELTDNLLSWTKSQSENFTPVLEKVELAQIVAECFKIYKPVSADKEITLSYENDHECLLLADKNMLLTVLRNLINNAVKFTPRKGRIEIFCQHASGMAKITIRDNGIGIPKNKLETIFEIDTNNMQYGTEGEKSSGLGLSVCKEFVEIMGGSISVESEENTGSDFTFTIPELQSAASAF